MSLRLNMASSDNVRFSFIIDGKEAEAVRASDRPVTKAIQVVRERLAGNVPAVFFPAAPAGGLVLEGL